MIFDEWYVIWRKKNANFVLSSVGSQSEERFKTAMYTAWLAGYDEGTKDMYVKSTLFNTTKDQS